MSRDGEKLIRVILAVRRIVAVQNFQFTISTRATFARAIGVVVLLVVYFVSGLQQHQAYEFRSSASAVTVQTDSPNEGDLELNRDHCHDCFPITLSPINIASVKKMPVTIHVWIVISFRDFSPILNTPPPKEFGLAFA